jgi:hypothetical protein
MFEIAPMFEIGTRESSWGKYNQVWVCSFLLSHGLSSDSFMLISTCGEKMLVITLDYTLLIRK